MFVFLTVPSASHSSSPQCSGCLFQLGESLTFNETNARTSAILAAAREN
jgi:hypothetical protein